MRKQAGREISEIVDGFRVEDPYELCFALYYLIDHCDDAPWLLRSGTSLMLYVLRMLPWYDDEVDDLDDLDDDWDEAIQYDRNSWMEREVPAEQIDYFHEKHGDRNLAQVIYDLCKTVVPIGLHPFEEDRRKLISEGMDEEKARKITDTAELLFLYEFQARHVTDNDWDRLLGDIEDVEEDDAEESAVPQLGGYWGKVAGTDTGISVEAYTAEEYSAEEYSAENERLRSELDATKKQLKTLSNSLAVMRQETNAEKAKYEHELKTFRLEHRELADLREMVFNSELTEDERNRREKVKEQYSYPYETKKRTVVFGGHDTWLKAIKPMLPKVKFVDVEQYSFSPELIRNADVVWVQNNCIGHSQFGNILKMTRQYGVQLRYFGYASAEKCAEMLVDWDCEG